MLDGRTIRGMEQAW